MSRRDSPPLDECVRVRDLLPDYVAGDLAAPEAELVRRHLAGCPGCARLHRETTTILRLAAEDSPPPLRAGFSEVVLARVAAEGRLPRGRRSRGRTLALAAAVLAALSAILLVGPRGVHRGGDGGGGVSVVAEEPALGDLLHSLGDAVRGLGRRGAGAVVPLVDSGRRLLASTGPSGGRDARIVEPLSRPLLDAVGGVVAGAARLLAGPAEGRESGAGGEGEEVGRG